MSCQDANPLHLHSTCTILSVLFRTEAFALGIVLMECLATKTITHLCKETEGANPKIGVQKHVLFSAAWHVDCLAGGLFCCLQQIQILECLFRGIIHAEPLAGDRRLEGDSDSAQLSRFALTEDV